MPHHKSCEKHMRTSSEERARNRAYRSHMRRLIRQVKSAQNQTEAQDILRQTTALLDRLAHKKIIHSNNAANYKSKLNKFVTKLPA